jgi:hypothetical protein
MRRQIYTVVTLTIGLTAWAYAGEKDSRQPLVVHEWGTFTVLQDAHGNPVDGVNINEESLPTFVHTLASELTPDSHELAPLIGLGYFTNQRARLQRSKGIRRYYHAARMRMETPIIYLYPPQDQPEHPIDVNVDFKGGWVTEWYPQADVVAPGYRKNQTQLMADLQPSTTGRITWQNVRAVPNAQVPSTDFPVWLAPRETAAPTISTTDGEAERYLFYRGVANLEAPLRVTHDSDRLTIETNHRSTCQIEDFHNMDLWLVNVEGNGILQYRRVSTGQHDPAPGQTLATTAASFDKPSGDGLPLLRGEMLAALIQRGLFRDEAEAMLNTWEASYFRTSGLRLFFTLPQSWTDRVLPLQVAGYERTEVVRAMIGRIELISNRQQQILEQITKGPISDRSWFMKWHTENYPASQAKVKELSEGRATLEDLGLQVPVDYRAYMELGRFRDALILHKIAHPTQRPADRDYVKVSGTLIRIHHPTIASGKVDRFTMSLPGENRILNLGELEVLDINGENVTAQAKVSQSSNPEGKFPIENLVDGNKDSFSRAEAEKNPWIKVEFDRPVRIGEVKIWNRRDFGGRFADRFNGARVAFFAGNDPLAAVDVRAVGHENLRTFAHNYGLPGR